MKIFGAIRNLRHAGCGKLVMVAWTFGSSALMAGQINWSLFNFDNNELSSGAPLPGGYEFQIGVFEGSFVPTPSNSQDWPIHW